MEPKKKRNPEVDAVALLGVNMFPFGAAGLKTSFLRVAMAAWFLEIRFLDLVWTYFLIIIYYCRKHLY